MGQCCHNTTYVATAGKPANFNDGYGDAHITGFKKLWELK